MSLCRNVRLMYTVVTIQNREIMWAIHKPRKFQFCEIQKREIQEVALIAKGR